ncbi:uncharacterized protein LOC103187315 isoform X2 [Callorhinchus milii]|uniref:Uncharacterized LOC103187315 n=1 Tax=Callorhinchus milii TaxID=7868 RepID=A0A4W3IYM8_CALMI|nr:uncharacterized protein LOC103187315 isoform X2 [Callorhinchus milii]|eukprot:gi/632976700/ref/XP_007904942.1/ PREDICTED: uncharacterized protein LOC103187315 isoform X2 [Callorhinchus milii]
MVLQHLRLALATILSRMLNWWRMTLVRKLSNTGPSPDPLCYSTTIVKHAAEFPELASGAITEQLRVPPVFLTDSQHTEELIQKVVALQEKSEEAKKRIQRTEEEIQCFKSELAKLQAEWECRCHQLPAEQREPKDQMHPNSSDQTIIRKGEDISSMRMKPIFLSERRPASQIQLPTARGQRKLDLTSSDKISISESKEGEPRTSCQPSLDFPLDPDEIDPEEVVSITGEPNGNLELTGIPSSSFPRGCDVLPSSALSCNVSRPQFPARFQADIRSRRPAKVFAPRSISEMQIGHRVKVILPSGRVGAGVVRYLGRLPDVPEFCLGVELECPENRQRDGVFEGQCYFHCNLSHGVFVTFSKVLMVLQ